MKRVLTAVILLSALFTSCGTVSKTAEGQKIRLSKEQIELQKLHNKRDEIIRHIKETSYGERSKAHPGYISCLDNCHLPKAYFWSTSYPEDDPVFKAYKKKIPWLV